MVKVKEEKSGSYFFPGPEEGDERSRSRVKRIRQTNLDPGLLHDVVGKYNSYPKMFGTLVIQTDGTGSYANGSGFIQINKLTNDTIEASYRRRDIRDDDDCRGTIVFQRESHNEWRGEWTGEAGGVGVWFITERRRRRNPNSRMLRAPGDVGKRRSRRAIPRTNYSLNKKTQMYNNVFYATNERKFVGQKTVNKRRIRVSDKNELRCAQLLNSKCQEEGIELPNPTLPPLACQDFQNVEDSQDAAIVPAMAVPAASDPQMKLAVLLAKQQEGQQEKLAVLLQKNLMQQQEKMAVILQKNLSTQLQEQQEKMAVLLQKNLSAQLEAVSKKMFIDWEEKFSSRYDKFRQQDREHNASERVKLEQKIGKIERRLEAKFEARIAKALEGKTFAARVPPSTWEHID